jgi:hypothetical protein
VGEASLREIKNQFYAWCACLSVDEACSNTRLVLAIERMERWLVAECFRAEDAAPRKEQRWNSL